MWLKDQSEISRALLPGRDNLCTINDFLFVDGLTFNRKFVNY